MSFVRQVARFNRVFTNPIARLWSGRLPPFAIVEHVGRRSGKKYRTPVMAFRAEHGFVVMLPYGRDSDWIRNLTAAGGGGLVRLGKLRVIAKSTVVPTAEAAGLLPKTVLKLIKLDGVHDVVKLDTWG